LTIDEIKIKMKINKSDLYIVFFLIIIGLLNDLSIRFLSSFTENLALLLVPYCVSTAFGFLFLKKSGITWERLCSVGAIYLCALFLIILLLSVFPPRWSPLATFLTKVGILDLSVITIIGGYFSFLKEHKENKRIQIERKKERKRERKQKEIRRKEEEILRRTQDENNRLIGNWLGKTRDGFVEIIFEDENRLMIIQNEMDVLSLTYHFVSVDEEITLEVNDEDRISQASLRFMKDGRLHFKSNQLEMVLNRRN